MTTTYTIRTNDMNAHRLHLAGPDLAARIEGIDDSLRSLTKHDAWPCPERTAVSLADWVRGELNDALACTGVPR